MIDTTPNKALEEWDADYASTFDRLCKAGHSKLTALELTKSEVTARRGERPSLAKAIMDQGGPLARQS